MTFAHLISHVMEDNDFLQMVGHFFPERVAILMAIVIVAWPVTIPALAIMKRGKV